MVAVIVKQSDAAIVDTREFERIPRTGEFLLNVGEIKGLIWEVLQIDTVACDKGSRIPEFCVISVTEKPAKKPLSAGYNLTSLRDSVLNYVMDLKN